MQFGKYRGGPNGQRNEADHRGKDALDGFIGAFQQALHHNGAVPPNEVLHLRDDFATRGVLTKHKSRHGDDDDEQRRHREQRVVGQCRAHARGVVVQPHRY